MKITSKDLINFENEIKNLYEKKFIKALIHLSVNNENQLINIFKRINKRRLVFFYMEKSLPCITKGIPKFF